MEARKSIVKMAHLDSVLSRVWWFIHPEAHSSIILSLQNLIMSHMCVCVSLQTPAHRWALWTAAHFSLPLNFHNSLPLNGDTYWGWHMLRTVFSIHWPCAQHCKHREGADHSTTETCGFDATLIWARITFTSYGISFSSSWRQFRMLRLLQACPLEPVILIINPRHTSARRATPWHEVWAVFQNISYANIAR